VNLTRSARLAAVAIAGILALAACGSDNSSSTSSSAAEVAGVACVGGQLKASGSSAQSNAIAEWVNAYQGTCTDATIDYQSNGSGAGIADFINNQTSFGGSDAALSGEDKTNADTRCASGPALDIPAVGGAIVLAYNLSGVDTLNLTPKAIAGIFDGSITKWNDPVLAAANDGLALPDATIAQFHRSDSSGTTYNLTNYLAAASGGAWTAEPSKDWTASGGQGSKGNEGVSSSVKSTPSSIGYVELSFAQNAGLATASVDNGAGPVEGTSANAAKTLTGATITGQGNDLALAIDYTIKDPEAYPIVLVTYEIVCESGNDTTTVDLTKSFLSYIVTDEGQGKLTEAGYVPIAGDLLTKVRAAVDSIS
jgi:phosphate transport system substrate-binding protein